MIASEMQAVPKDQGLSVFDSVSDAAVPLLRSVLSQASCLSPMQAVPLWLESNRRLSRDMTGRLFVLREPMITKLCLLETCSRADDHETLSLRNLLESL